MIVDTTLGLNHPTIDRVVKLIVRCAELDASAVWASRENDLPKFQAAIDEARAGMVALEMAGRMAVAAMGQSLLDQIKAEVAAKESEVMP